MTTGLRIVYLYHDIDLTEVNVTVNNGAFSGSTNVYLSRGETAEIAAALAGFPTNPKDTRDYTIGAFGAKFAGGAVRFEFYCKDLAGHPCIRATVESACSTPAQVQSAVIILDFEPAALDRFLIELRELEHTQGSASLTP